MNEGGGWVRVSHRDVNKTYLFSSGKHLDSSNNISINNQTNQTSAIKETSSRQTKAISGTEVTSPIIGTVYHAPEPGAKKFVEVGKKIKKGDTVMIVEAMKTMNHVPSTADGIVKKICVEDGQPVEFGQTIIILE